MTLTEPNTWESPFLQGALAPVLEERDDTALTVVGEIPAALNGMFVRTGPNPQFAPMGAYHPFDGDGMLHAVYIEDGVARYRKACARQKPDFHGAHIFHRHRGRKAGARRVVGRIDLAVLVGVEIGVQGSNAGCIHGPDDDITRGVRENIQLPVAVGIEGMAKAIAWMSKAITLQSSDPWRW